MSGFVRDAELNVFALAAVVLVDEVVRLCRAIGPWKRVPETAS